MENSDKVQQKLLELNREAINAALPEVLPAPGPWIHVQGFNFIPAATSNYLGYQIIPGSGYGVKLFLNTRTGELRMYSAILFM